MSSKRSGARSRRTVGVRRHSRGPRGPNHGRRRVKQREHGTSRVPVRRYSRSKPKH